MSVIVDLAHLRRIASVAIRGEGTSILAVDIFRLWDKCFFIGDADIDGDGAGGNPEGDRFYQPHTSYRLPNGDSLNGRRVPFMVLPPAVFLAVPEIVMGCQGWITYIKTGRRTPVMVGDGGPTFKVGEVSPCAAERVGMPSSPVNGGEDDYSQVIYEFLPGVPAVIDGIHYALQPYRHAA